ncbi:hypothetical protein JZ751_003523 [Albula glossodonta]|uniref:Uncharacterized protein n=1 Tax=Albula glossodonta TaxID=121402 RepID=A0A8T2N7E4_9TELE|nr:hypothetical protein JZ751_003523 [Albula glossodonta]
MPLSLLAQTGSCSRVLANLLLPLTLSGHYGALPFSGGCSALPSGGHWPTLVTGCSLLFDRRRLFPSNSSCCLLLPSSGDRHLFTTAACSFSALASPYSVRWAALPFHGWPLSGLCKWLLSPQQCCLPWLCSPLQSEL